ncbi:MAG: radical SAM protein [Proteobacteria bacterium]|jgi:radical SAM protein with 4Fe4S-binding SPASM domain|nr:radical SAM protein [Pseudomonadota bacterium]
MREFGFQWHVTDRCDGSCAHCYQSDFTSARELGLGGLVDVAGRVLGGLRDHRVSINVTGGEPFLQPRLTDLLGALHRHEALDEVNVITNGTIADRAVLDEIAALPKLGCFKISIEGGDRGIDDALRWPGHFDAVMQNLPRFLATGRPVVLMLTLSRRNAASIASAVDLARESGASGVIFERFVPLGRGAAMRGDLLGPREWSAAARAIAAAAGVDAEPGDLLAHRAFWVDTSPGADEPLSGALCNLGPDSMCLMPDGTVYPCRRLPIAVGNVLEEPFAAIRERLAAWAPDAIRPRLSGPRCAACDLPGCAGCRALASAVSGDPLADDPQCANER